MAILDITNPLQAVVKGMVSGEANDNYTSSIALVRKNDCTQYAVTSGGGSIFRVIDVSNPFVPIRLFSDTFSPGLSDVQDIAVYGEYAFLIEEDDGQGGGDRLHTIDVSDKVQPRGVAELQLDELYTGSLAATAQGCGFVPAGARGLRIVCDTSMTPSPSLLVWLPLLKVSVD